MVFHWSVSDSKSPGLFSVFWPISTMLLFVWSPLILLFLSSPVLVPILWWLYQGHQLQLVSPSLSCSIVFSLARSVYLSFFSFSFNFPRWSAETAKSTIQQIMIIMIIFLKYLDLARELKKLWNMKVTIVQIVIGAFGTITKELLKGLLTAETIQMTALLRTTRILRRVLETCGDLLSLKLQWKTIS